MGIIQENMRKQRYINRNYPIWMIRRKKIEEKSKYGGTYGAIPKV